MCDSIRSHYLHLERSLRMRRVTWPITGGHKWSTFLKPLTPIYLFTLYFYSATTKIKPWYTRKTVFSHYESYKVYCACAVSRDLCPGGPIEPHVTIFWPRIAYSLYNFYGAMAKINGSFILEHSHIKAIFTAKNLSKSVPKMAVFRKFKGPNIKYSHRDPQKALPYPEWRVLTYFA